MSTALTLYEIEEHLQALVDTEDLVPDEQMAAFAGELAEAGEAALAKRDRCIQFLRHMEGLIGFSEAEEKRLKARRESLEKGLDRFKRYLIVAVQEYGKQTSKTIRRLEGRVGDLCAVQNPPSVTISDEKAVPEEYRFVTVKMPLRVWQEMLTESAYSAIDLGDVKVSVDRTRVKQALLAGADVPGADLDMGGARLEVK